MPKALQYGPQPYVSESNPDWIERQSVPGDPTLASQVDAPAPLCYPIDLQHLSQQSFTQSKEAKKRWFLTAFVAPEDRHLLVPAANPEPAKATLQHIKGGLLKPASGCTAADLEALQQEVLSLFKQEEWIGVALAMVDNKTLSIDMLNTLIQWQALYH